MENLCLVVGLGNPSADYTRTRHNAGFMALDELGREWQVVWRLDGRFSARLATADQRGRKVLLCQPQTYMNCSGESVGRLKTYYRVPLERVLVVVDDADLPVGEIRLRPEGGSGGHHGLESVEQHLGSRDYPRLRIGIGRESQVEREITSHVLGRFRAEELEIMRRVFERVARQVECWVSCGLQRAMNQFNGMGIHSGRKETE